LQRYVNDVKADISREMQVEELRSLQQQVEQSARDLESSVNKEVGTLQESLDQAVAGANQVGSSPPEEAPAPIPSSVTELQVAAGAGAASTTTGEAESNAAAMPAKTV
jgi:sec-independent protein translocase protein TatB